MTLTEVYLLILAVLVVVLIAVIVAGGQITFKRDKKNGNMSISVHKSEKERPNAFKRKRRGQ
jgi:hypothetical protein